MRATARHHIIAFLIILGAAAGTLGCRPAASRPRPEPSVETRPALLAAEHLPNLVQVNDKVLSGGQPDGAEGFAELRRLGVRTVISVDGARPDVAAAAAHGLRYVHLPIGYNGISAERTRELAKAVRDLDGKIYIHCHHGKHRSPAAAVTACVAAGLLRPSESRTVLELAGTSPSYRGLYQAAEQAAPLDRSTLDAIDSEFASVVALPPLAEAMVDLDNIHQRMDRIAAAGWRAPPDHPDLDPAHEALMLREQFTEMLRLESVQQQPAEFRAHLADSMQAAEGIETALRAWESAGRPEPVPSELTSLAARVSANCMDCHARFRDVPLSE